MQVKHIAACCLEWLKLVSVCSRSSRANFGIEVAANLSPEVQGSGACSTRTPSESRRHDGRYRSGRSSVARPPRVARTDARWQVSELRCLRRFGCRDVEPLGQMPPPIRGGHGRRLSVKLISFVNDHAIISLSWSRQRRGQRLRRCCGGPRRAGACVDGPSRWGAGGMPLALDRCSN